MISVFKTMINILIVDDHEVVREGLKLVLKDWRTESSIFTAADASEAKSMIARHEAFELVLLDLKLPDASRFDLLEYFVAHLPSVPVVIFSGDDRPSIIEEAFSHGARGYIPKSSSQDVVDQALNEVLKGGIFRPESILSEHAESQRLSKFRQLTPRQMEILLLISQGKTNKQIADELNMSPATVRSYLTIVFRALAVKNRTEAVRAAQTLGLIE